MLAPGVVLSNRYVLDERIAAGGMGEVWRGTDRLLRRGIAVKVLLPLLMSDAEFITRFRTEARLMAALRHPGVVQVYDYGEDADVGGRKLDYLVMEYIEGTPLSQQIKAAGRLGATETMQILAQAAEALQVAHEAGIVHRDVKPSNLLVRPDGSVVLVDFGVARSIGATSITGTDIVLGSAHYMAPEQAEGRPVSATTDVYAIGAVAYCCLTGHPPHAGDNAIQVLTRLVHGDPPTLPADVPPAVAAVVLRAMDRDPTRRYQSAASLAEAARARSGPTSARSRTAYVFSEFPPPATPAGPVEAPARSGRRRKTTVAVLAAGVAIGVAASVAGGVLRPRDSEAQVPPVDRPAGASSEVPARQAANGRQQASSPAPGGQSPVDVCGPRFEVIDSEALLSGGAEVGRVYLLYDADAGETCATTFKSVDLGVETDVSAYVQVEDGVRKFDSSPVKFYAGPVVAETDGECVWWGGSIEGTTYDSPPEHCQ